MLWDLAPKFNAAIIIAEHRFYGASLPFGNESYSVSRTSLSLRAEPVISWNHQTYFQSIANMGYLTSEQALADYAALLVELKVLGSS